MTRELAGLSVSNLALGTAALGLDQRISDQQAKTVIEAALDRGIRVIDTARSYTTTSQPGRSECLVAACVGRRDDVLIVVKGGSTRVASDRFVLDGSFAGLCGHVQDSLRHLRREAIDLYVLHWPDPEVPIEESVGALHDLRVAGLIRHVGVSNVDVPLLLRAAATTELSAVENPLPPDQELPTVMLAQCTALGLTFLAYGCLGHDGAAGRSRVLAPLARETGTSPTQLVLAWLRQQSDAVLPLVGARRTASIADSVLAQELVLEPEILDRVGDALGHPPDPDSAAATESREEPSTC